MALHWKRHMAKLAAAHPGKLGDALYTLPMMRYIYGQTGAHFDFYTSDLCLPLKELFEYQPYIDNFIIAPGYQVERTDMGVQPWYINVPSNYEHVYQMGFQTVPDEALHQYMAKQHGIAVPLAVHYEYPDLMSLDDEYPFDGTLPNDYICIAPRGDTSFRNLFNSVADRTTSVIIGGKGDYTGHGINMTDLNMLDTLTILSGAKGFLGLMSSQLVLANGFSFPKVAPWDGISWDMRHVIRQSSNHYPINPSTEEVLALLGR